jgi:sugar-phosphatase
VTPATSTGDRPAAARPIEAVIFDMDGVLIDSEPLWREVEREVFGTLGISVTDADLERTMGVRIGEVVDQWYRRQPWNGPGRDEVAQAIVRGVEEAIRARGVLLPGASAAVDRMAQLGLRLAIASSSSPALIDAVLAVGGLRDRFEVAHSAQEEPAGKPDPAVYLTTAALLRVCPERCLAVEDSRAGVQAAKAAGMTCVAVPAVRPDGPGFHGADVVLESLLEFDDRVWERTRTAPAAVAS